MTSSSQLTISLAQMDCRLGQPEENFAQAELLVAEAARRGSHLVLLPELWSTAYDLDRVAELASPLAQDAAADGWFGRFATLAREHGVWLAGSLLEARDGQFYNCLALYGPDGSLAAAYRKTHLFRLMAEEKYLAPGEEAVVVDLPWGKVGLSICYDLRFPELYRRYALAGARLMLVPAEWPHPRRDALAHVAAGAGHRKSMLCGRLQSGWRHQQQHLLWRFRRDRPVGRNPCRRRRGADVAYRGPRSGQRRSRPPAHPCLRRPAARTLLN